METIIVLFILLVLDIICITILAYSQRRKKEYPNITVYIGEFKSYKGYLGSMEYSHTDEVFFGKVINTESDLIMYEADTIKDLEKEFHESVDEYLELKNSKFEDEFWED